MFSRQVMWRSKFPPPNSCWASALARLPSGPSFGWRPWRQRTKLQRKLRGPGVIPFGWVWMAISIVFFFHIGNRWKDVDHPGHYEQIHGYSWFFDHRISSYSRCLTETGSCSVPRNRENGPENALTAKYIHFWAGHCLQFKPFMELLWIRYLQKFCSLSLDQLRIGLEDSFGNHSNRTLSFAHGLNQFLHVRGGRRMQGSVYV